MHFEDDATVNCHFQAHSFEDRILKIGPLFVRRGATVGRNAVLFYGADVGPGPGARVAPHSAVMKGDVLPGRRTYAGHPARPEGEPPSR